MLFFCKRTLMLGTIATASLFSGTGMAQEMCSLLGSTGPCQIMANAVALKNAGCLAWANSDYQGVCLGGKLEGMGLLRNPHPDGKKVSFYLANFRAGIPDEPIVAFHSEAIVVNYVQQAKQFDACVWFDESGKKSEGGFKDEVAHGLTRPGVSESQSLAVRREGRRLSAHLAQGAFCRT